MNSSENSFNNDVDDNDLNPQDDMEEGVSRKHERQIAENNKIEISVDGINKLIDQYDFLLKQINPDKSYWNLWKLTVVGMPEKKITSASILEDFINENSSYPEFITKKRGMISSLALTTGLKKRGGKISKSVRKKSRRKKSPRKKSTRKKSSRR